MATGLHHTRGLRVRQRGTLGGQGHRACAPEAMEVSLMGAGDQSPIGRKKGRETPGEWLLARRGSRAIPDAERTHMETEASQWQHRADGLSVAGLPMG